MLACLAQTTAEPKTTANNSNNKREYEEQFY